MKAVEEIVAFSHSVQEIDGVKVHSFKYNLNIEGMWDEDHHLNMRGITFVNEKVVALPFAKFFNVGQTEETQNLDLSNPQSIYQKMDGSLISFFFYDEYKITLKTMKSIESDVALDCNNYVIKHRPDIMGYVTRLLSFNYSPMFEYVSQKSRIVINYGESDLYYLGSRNMETGEIVLPHDDHEINNGRSESIKLPRLLKQEDLEEFLERDDEEGVVITLKNGMMVKMKTDTYCALHRIITEISPKRIFENILEDKLDDAKGLLYQHGLGDDIKQLETVEKYYQKRFAEISKIATDLHEEHKHLERKEIAIKLFQSKELKCYAPMVMKLLDDRSTTDLVNKHIFPEFKEKCLEDFM